MKQKILTRYILTIALLCTLWNFSGCAVATGVILTTTATGYAVGGINDDKEIVIQLPSVLDLERLPRDTLIVVHLTNGGIVNGAVISYDRDMALLGIDFPYKKGVQDVHEFSVQQPKMASVESGRFYIAHKDIAAVRVVDTDGNMAVIGAAVGAGVGVIGLLALIKISIGSSGGY